MGKQQHKKEGRKPVIVIDRELCKGCEICVTICPKQVLKMSDNPTDRGIHVPEVHDINKCTSCLMCQFYCPDFAIYLQKSEE
ncbi:MAG: 4Fe-4S dicluster domain-containing protein [Candidatus Jordarchaeum sp.]|uniref:4Fe-4S dicluster domain-containing protein n=1 Tax=Candidatus Jordarchaeum sp. TaxID=2823881 RepID=UPI00404B2DA4